MTAMTASASLFLLLALVVFAQRDEPTRDTLHITAQNGVTGPPAGVGLVNSTYRLYYRQNYLKLVESSNALQWSEPSDAFTESINAGHILLARQRSRPGFVGFGVLNRQVNNQLYGSAEIIGVVEKGSIKSLGRFETQKGAESALFEYGDELYLLTQEGQGCNFRVRTLDDSGIRCAPSVILGLINVSFCRSPQIITVDKITYFVTSVKYGPKTLDNDKWQSVYSQAAIARFPDGCLSVTTSYFFPFDGGLDGIDYKFGKNKNGNVMTVGWMGNNYISKEYNPKEGWQFGLTTLRGLGVRNGRLVQALNGDMLTYLGNCCATMSLTSSDSSIKAKSGTDVKSTCSFSYDFDSKVCPKENGRAYHFNLQFQYFNNLKSSSVAIKFYNTKNEFVAIQLNPDMAPTEAYMRLTFDRSMAKGSPALDVSRIGHNFTADENIDSTVKVLLDRGSVEVYAQWGKLVMTNIYRSESPLTHLCIAARGGDKNKFIKSSTVVKLRSIYTGDHKCKGVGSAASLYVFSTIIAVTIVQLSF